MVKTTIAVGMTDESLYTLMVNFNHDPKLDDLRRDGKYITKSQWIKMAILHYYKSKLTDKKMKELYEQTNTDMKFASSLSDLGNL